MDRELQVETIARQLKTYYSLVFSPDDSRLVGGGYDVRYTNWNVLTKDKLSPSWFGRS